MHRSHASGVVFLVGMVGVGLVDPGWGFAQCGFTQPFGHLIDLTALVGCQDAEPVAGLAEALGSAVNSGTSNIVCERDGEQALGAVGCYGAGAAGDGIVHLEGNWGNPGVNGCPNLYGMPGAGRNVYTIIDNRLQPVLLSIGYSIAYAGYPAEFAHPSGGTSVNAIACGEPGSTTIRLDEVRRSAENPGSEIEIDVTALAPGIHNDCDEGSVARVYDLGTCTEGTFPEIHPGSVYSRTGVCHVVPPDLRASSWTFRGSPGADGHITIRVPDPGEESCVHVGATFRIGGEESDAIGGIVEISGNRNCTNADGDPYGTCDGDCDDSSPAVHPGVTEICDGLDNDCDSSIDEGLGQTTCGVGACARTVDRCVGGALQTCIPGDPAPEVCDGMDNDCDGQTDEGGCRRRRPRLD